MFKTLLILILVAESEFRYYISYARYARKHFANADQTMTKEIQRAMALLAFKPQMACSPYKV